MDFWIYYFFSALWLLIGLLLGYRWHAWEVAHDIANCEQCQAEREVPYTSGAAYDACLDEPTDHDAVARRLLNSW